MTVWQKKKKVPITQVGQAEDKKKALEAALAQIENYGKGAIMRLGDDIPVNVEAISTGSLSLDLALGIGGVPRGRIVEIFGPESSGKTTLRCIFWQARRSWAARSLLSTSSTRLSPPMPELWGSTSTAF